MEAASRALGVTVGALLAENTPDAWADQAVALARAVPAPHRALVLAILQAIVTETRRGSRLARRYERPPPGRTGSVAEKRPKTRKP